MKNHRAPAPLVRVPTSMAEIVPVPGTCVVCGCTDEKACEGGCSWVDRGALCCSRCVLHLGAVVMKALAIACGADLAPIVPKAKGKKRG